MLRAPSGAIEETQFGLFGHGLMVMMEHSGPLAPALKVANKVDPNTITE